jgi:hypothetical protein
MDKKNALERVQKALSGYYNQYTNAQEKFMEDINIISADRTLEVVLLENEAAK